MAAESRKSRNAGSQFLKLLHLILMQQVFLDNFIFKAYFNATD